MKKITFTLLFTLLIISIGSGQNLLTNGDFEAGATGWAGNALNSVDDGSGTNKRNEANIAVAGNPWDASLAYPGLVLEAGEKYILSYTAYTDATTGTRTMAAGIGKNAADWNSLTDNPALTATATTFTYTYTVNYPNPENSRVVFDMGAQAGYVFIDDVSLTKVIPPAPENLLTNGDFEAGATGWAGNALNSVDDGSGTNKRNEANIAVAGNPWDVSLAYPGLVLEAGEKYILSYTAYTDATNWRQEQWQPV